MTSDENATPSPESGADAPVIKKISSTPARPVPAGGVSPARPVAKMPVKPAAVRPATAPGTSFKKPASVAARTPGVIPGKKVVSPAAVAEPEAVPASTDETVPDVEPVATPEEAAAPVAEAKVIPGKKVVRTGAVAKAGVGSSVVGAKEASVVKGKKRVAGKAAPGLAGAAAKAREMAAKQKAAGAGGAKKPARKAPARSAPAAEAEAGVAKGKAPAQRCAWATALLVFSFLLSVACVGVLSLSVMDEKVLPDIRKSIGSVAVMVQDVKIGPEAQDADMTNFLAGMTADLEAMQRAVSSAKASMGGSGGEPVVREPVSLGDDSMTSELPSPPDLSDVDEPPIVEELPPVVEESDTDLDSMFGGAASETVEDAPIVEAEETTDDITSLVETVDAEPVVVSEKAPEPVAPVEAVEADIAGDMEALFSDGDAAPKVETPTKKESTEKDSTDEDILDLDALLAE